MGCILYELVTNGNRAFASDIDVLNYLISSTPFELPLDDLDEFYCTDLADLNTMLDVDGSKRPSAKFLRSQFGLNRALQIGDFFEVIEDYKNSLEAYEQASRHFPHGIIYENLGRIYAMTDDYTSAATAYKGAIKEGVFVAGELARVLCLCGSYDEAIENYRIAIAQNSNSGSLLGGLALAYQLNGDQDMARTMYQEALKLVPDDIFLRTRLARILLVKGDIATAKEVFNDYFFSDHLLQYLITDRPSRKRRREDNEDSELSFLYPQSPISTPTSADTLEPGSLAGSSVSTCALPSVMPCHSQSVRDRYSAFLNYIIDKRLGLETDDKIKPYIQPGDLVVSIWDHPLPNSKEEPAAVTIRRGELFWIGHEEGSSVWTTTYKYEATKFGWTTGRKCFASSEYLLGESIPVPLGIFCQPGDQEYVRSSNMPY